MSYPESSNANTTLSAGAGVVATMFLMIAITNLGVKHPAAFAFLPLATFWGAATLVKRKLDKDDERFDVELRDSIQKAVRTGIDTALARNSR